MDERGCYAQLVERQTEKYSAIVKKFHDQLNWHSHC